MYENRLLMMGTSLIERDKPTSATRWLDFRSSARFLRTL